MGGALGSKRVKPIRKKKQLSQRQSQQQQPPPPPPPPPQPQPMPLQQLQSQPQQQQYDPQTLRNVFDYVDANGDGCISRAEVILALRKDQNLANLVLLPCRIRQEDGSRDEFERVFQAMDEDDSKGLDWEEFRDYFKKKLTQANQGQQLEHRNTPLVQPAHNSWRDQEEQHHQHQ